MRDTPAKLGEEEQHERRPDHEDQEYRALHVLDVSGMQVLRKRSLLVPAEGARLADGLCVVDEVDAEA